MNRLYYGDNLQVLKESIDLFHNRRSAVATALRCRVMRAGHGNGVPWLHFRGSKPFHYERGLIKDESVDLIYLDPPFNSKRDYNLLFKTPKGQSSEAQIEAFKDTWHRGAQADIGLFITLAAPTKAMLTEAAAAGFYTSPNGKKYARLQLLAIEGLLDWTQRTEHPDYEPDTGYKKAKAENGGEQTTLL